jgi:serine/threonine protein kinase
LGLVHRDIKPANVFLCHRGGVPDCVKVLDFGLVREYRDRKPGRSHLTAEQGMLGTPLFMPPEVIKNSFASDPRSDIYSVGALGYYLLTAAHVFDAESVFDLYQKHLTEAPIPPARRPSRQRRTRSDPAAMSGEGTGPPPAIGRRTAGVAAGQPARVGMGAGGASRVVGRLPGHPERR